MPESTGEYAWFDYMISDYICWISESSGKHPTFYPSKNIQIGDYGVIDDKTCEFKRRGNIFEDEEILAIIPELATNDLWKPQTSEDDKLVLTRSMEMTDLGPNEDAEMRLRFEGSGEFLVIYRPRSVNLPQPIDLAKLSKIQKLNGMFVVTGTVTCPAYALYYLTDSSSTVNTVNISLDMSVDAKLRVKQGWTWGIDGLHKDGYNPQGDYDYTPLFTLTEISPANKSDNAKDASGHTVPLVHPVRLKLSIPAPSAGDGNELFTTGQIGIAPWISGKSKRPEKWKNRPSAPSDPDGNRENHGESVDTSALEQPITPVINQSTQSNQAVGAADQTRVYYSRMPESESSGCFTSCCCFQ